MPIIVTSSTIQSNVFMRTTVRTAQAKSRRRQRWQRQKDKCRARCGSRARREIRPRWMARPAMTSFAERNQIGKQTVRAGHAGGQLAEKVQAGIDEIAFAILRDEQRAGLRFLAGIGARENRC